MKGANMSKNDLSPVPPAGRSNKGPKAPDGGLAPSDLATSAADSRHRNVDKQRRQGNPKANPPPQGYQQARSQLSPSHKTPAADRSHGGPGSSQQDAPKP